LSLGRIKGAQAGLWPSGPVYQRLSPAGLVSFPGWAGTAASWLGRSRSILAGPVASVPCWASVPAGPISCAPGGPPFPCVPAGPDLHPPAWAARPMSPARLGPSAHPPARPACRPGLPPRLCRQPRFLARPACWLGRALAGLSAPFPGWAESGGSGLAGITPPGHPLQPRLGRFGVIRLGQAGIPLAQAGLPLPRPT
jgi:hypothetical protein